MERIGAPPGEANGNARLTAAKVRRIRKRYADKKATQRELAAEYGLTFEYVSRLIRRKYWKHIE